MIPNNMRELVAIRDGHRCARCNVSILNQPSSVHHRKPRGMGGTKDPRANDPRNLIRLCGTGTTGCHGWVESNRHEARSTGWLIQSYDGLDLPMITTTGDRIELRIDGTRWESRIVLAGGF